MKGLLLVAHGSRIKESADETIRLTTKLRELAPGAFDIVENAFLEKATPTFREKIQEYVDNGVTDIVVLPYLLATGRHVATDIPQVISEITQKYPHVAVRVLPHIGAAKGMETYIWNHIKETE